jgi:hypothetical protein
MHMGCSTTSRILLLAVASFVSMSSGGGDLYYDNLAVGDQRIGCSGIPPQSNSPTSPPSQPWHQHLFLRDYDSSRSPLMM